MVNLRYVVWDYEFRQLVALVLLSTPTVKNILYSVLHKIY